MESDLITIMCEVTQVQQEIPGIVETEPVLHGNNSDIQGFLTPQTLILDTLSPVQV